MDSANRNSDVNTLATVIAVALVIFLISHGGDLGDNLANMCR